MEKRFSFKDFILVVLLIALLISVWLGIKQYDRQWDQLDQIRTRLNEQGKDLRAIQTALASGVSVGQATGPATTGPANFMSDAKENPFARIYAARQLPDFAMGGALVDAFGNTVGNLSPLVSSDAYASTVQSYVLESLVDRNPDTLDWKPLLCTSWKITDRVDQREKAIADLVKAGKSEKEAAADPSVPPAIKIAFQMRPNVCFSDGVPLTADDVVFTYQFIMDPKINAPRERSSLERIAKVEKTSPTEVTFTFNEPYFEAFDLCGSIGILPKHFYSQFAPEDFNNSVGYLLGSGPYRLINPTTWRPGTLIQLVRNDRYWGLNGAFDRLIWREFTSDMARLTAFRNGDTDLFPSFPEQYAKMINDQTLTARTQHFEYQNPIGGYRYVGWNQLKNDKPTFFADVRVRRAMTLLLDRKRMIDQIMLGYASEASGPFNPLSKQFNPAVKPWPYDVEQARKLLTEAGFTPGNDGILHAADGTPFRFKLTYPSGNANYESMGLFMKDAYARAGIAMELDPLDWSVLVEKLKKKDFDAITLGWTAGIESDIYQMFHSSQTQADGDNATSYKSERLDKVMEQARRTVDEAKRMDLWHQAHQILHEDQPYTFLFFRKDLIFIDGKIHNVQQVKLGLNPYVEWFVPKAQQRIAQ